MARWNVRDEDTRELLGGLSEVSFSEMKRNPNQVLDIDGLTNISHVVGIFKALKTIYFDELADRWVQLPNTNPIFDGQSPLAYMIKGGRQKMQTVRRLLDARVEGV